MMDSVTAWRNAQPHVLLEAKIKGKNELIEVPSYSLR